MTVVISSSENRAPSANIVAQLEAYIGDSITFTGSGSSDPDRDDSIASYYWNFGDGTNSSEADPTHKYSTAGSYNIMLTVTDQSGKIGISSKVITIKSKVTDDSPGFEFLLALIAMIFVSITIRRKK